MTEFRYVGKNIPRTLETEKVTGRAIYIDDLKLPGMLYGKILYSSYANARLKSVDTSRANFSTSDESWINPKLSRSH